MKIDFHKARLSMFVAIVACSLAQISYFSKSVSNTAISHCLQWHTQEQENWTCWLKKEIDTIGYQMANSKTKVAHIGFKPKTIPSLLFYEKF